MYKTLLLVFGLLLGAVASSSAAGTATVGSGSAKPSVSLLKRTPRDKAKSGRTIHRPNYKRYKGPGNPNRGFIALFS
ncbi:hypothetical protein E5K00_04215 [Hymenobacter aquaticus]|uniref:Uncharacterized protein n=1 Tax=Hymenobacter aquaticus TaxID=1867101 RepID=A0A4Z0Q2X4_9BACT|nr:hypothetical protein E5K00_04215 [Hymenobacter aquaticus]